MMNYALSPAHLWALLGAALIIADLFTATFVLFFFGVGAVVTALTTWAGLTPQFGSQLLCFSLTAAGATVLFRKTAKKYFGKRADTPEYSDYLGQRAVVTEPIPAGGEGRVKFRGSEWIAFSGAGAEIKAGETVVIEDVDGIRLKVAPR